MRNNKKKTSVWQIFQDLIDMQMQGSSLWVLYEGYFLFDSFILVCYRQFYLITMHDCENWYEGWLWQFYIWLICLGLLQTCCWDFILLSHYYDMKIRGKIWRLFSYFLIVGASYLVVVENVWKLQRLINIYTVGEMWWFGE